MWIHSIVYSVPSGPWDWVGPTNQTHTNTHKHTTFSQFPYATRIWEIDWNAMRKKHGCHFSWKKYTFRVFWINSASTTWLMSSSLIRFPVTQMTIHQSWWGWMLSTGRMEGDKSLVMSNDQYLFIDKFIYFWTWLFHYNETCCLHIWEIL